MMAGRRSTPRGRGVRGDLLVRGPGRAEAEVLEEDAVHLVDRLGILLDPVVGADPHLRGHAVDMGAAVGYDPVGRLRHRARTLRSDDRMEVHALAWLHR